MQHTELEEKAIAGVENLCPSAYQVSLSSPSAIEKQLMSNPSAPMLLDVHEINLTSPSRDISEYPIKDEHWKCQCDWCTIF